MSDNLPCLSNKSSKIEKLFWSNVIKTENCWIYTKSLLSSGYGRVGQKRAHRFSYELHCGAIPENMYVCHRCDNPPCVNPNHLFLGTPKDNVTDRVNKRRCNTPAGDRHWNRKLTESLIITIKEMINNGMHYRDVADKFNVSHATIHDIKQNKTWKHV